MHPSRVVLKPGRDKAVRNRHPWVFSGAVQRLEGPAVDGDVVVVCDARGEFLARGYLNRRSQIAVRLLTWQADQAIDDEFWRRRLVAAIDLRTVLPGLANTSGHGGPSLTTAYRLVNAESDRLPGLIVDRYGDYVVIQVLTLGMEPHKRVLVEALMTLLRPAGVFERSDVDVRDKEGLPSATGLLAGQSPRNLIEVTEAGHRFQVDVRSGQKTGFYLDQRVNRQRVAAYVKPGAEVLNAFAYTGAFAVYAAAAGAGHVTNIESSAEALRLAETHWALNELDHVPAENVIGDVFQVLREYRDAGRQFDLVILDPPKFAYSQAQVRAACRGYKDINWLALRLLRPGGILATFSCSGLVSRDLFQKVVFGAAVDAGRDVQVLEHLSQSPDHPTLLSFPEGAYLKGLICRVADG
jgi:23S rRNA (cytosine1962-C5)-methyltransferase